MSETYGATPVVRHPRGGLGINAASRPGATLIIDSATSNPAETSFRQPQGGHEPFRTTIRDPQDPIGAGTRTSLFDDEDQSDPDAGQRGLSDDGEWHELLKKLQK